MEQCHEQLGWINGEYFDRGIGVGHGGGDWPRNNAIKNTYVD